MERSRPTIILYLEYLHFFGGFMYKKIGTGLLSSYRNQKKILAHAGISFSESWRKDADILQVNTPWLWSVVLIHRAKRQGKKVIIWAHVTAEDIKGVFRGSALLSPLAKKYLTHAYALADMIFAPSAYTKTLLVAYGLSPEKIVVMSNGVDTEMFVLDQQKRQALRAQKGIAENALMIGTVGLVIKRKGMDTFLSLARRFPTQPFFWFGKIYSAALAPGLPKELPDNFRATGFVEDIVAAYGAIDVFIFASYEENEGMSILEAASMGLPIIVRDIPVYDGWLVHGENCLKAGREEEFSACLEKLIADAPLRARLGAGARALAERHSLKAMASKTEALYATLIS